MKNILLLLLTIFSITLAYSQVEVYQYDEGEELVAGLESLEDLNDLPGMEALEVLESMDDLAALADIGTLSDWSGISMGESDDGSYQEKEYKLAHNTGKIMIEDIDEVDIEGYSGNEIVFKTRVKSSDMPDRAAGLKLVNSAGLDDNTGLGLSVTKEDGNVKVVKVGKLHDNKVTIMLPQNMGVYYSHSSHSGDDVMIKGVAGEIEISAVYNNVVLKDLTGPMAVKTVYGSIDATFSALDQDGSISLNSVYDFVDVTIPSSAAYNVSARSPYGSIFSDVDIAVAKSGDMRKISSSDIKGTVNGGGVEVTLKSAYENVYLRKG